MANGLGFVGFAGMYYYIYDRFIKNHSNFDNQLLYWLFFILWAPLYGVFYYSMETVTRKFKKQVSPRFKSPVKPFDLYFFKSITNFNIIKIYLYINSYEY